MVFGSSDTSAMEQDREETNLGPDTPLELHEEPVPVPKQPSKRFIGRRAAEAIAQRKALQDGSTENSGAISAPRSTRTPRLLSRVPPEILHDEDINAAISLLPSNYSFEIHKTIHRIRSSDSHKVALQFPEGLLLFATTISDILTRFCPGIETLIMGDVTYGACCIDDYTAKALGCDLLIHYGHSCLVPVDVTSIKTLYVFVTIGIDVEHLMSTIERNFTCGKRIALVSTIQFNATLHSILPRLRNQGYDPILPRSAPLSAGEILGCTAPTLTAPITPAASAHISTPKSQNEADLILYLGDGRFHLESILIASPTLRNHTYRYDPYTRRLSHETYAHAEMHSLRSHAIATARKTLEPTPSSAEPVTWALIHGTLGRQGNPHTVALIQRHLARRGIPYITLLLSEIFPAKLASMSADVAVWVQVACPRLSIDWGYAFERPLLSPYEAMLALGSGDEAGWIESGREDPRGESMQESGNGNHMEERHVGTYPMNFYEKNGLGRTRLEDLLDDREVLDSEVHIT